MKNLINRYQKFLVTLSWILVLIGMFVMSPITGFIVYVSLLIILSLLISGYYMAVWDNFPLTSSTGNAISFISFLILLVTGFFEWYFVNFNSDDHQSGWHFTGAIMLLITVIGISYLITGLIDISKKLPFISFSTPNGKIFFWVSLFIYAAWLIPSLISSL